MLYDLSIFALYVVTFSHCIYMTQALSCFGWMHFFFALVGDSMPNLDEIHLEPIYIHEIWKEYKEDMVSVSNEYVDVSTFGKLWLCSFPHVKIREHKAVGLKCNTCAMLSDLRRTFKDQASREYIKQLHAFHRTTYMGERLAYYVRRTSGEQYQRAHLSLISDGMAQIHCQLPWCANLTTLQSLPHHIQGVIAHGRKIFMYRTFHNISNGANLQIHTLLKSIEDVMLAEKGKLPDTVYVQIDGGSENTAKAVLAICELLIHKKLCKRIELTRLIPGHTHDDIDSKFAIIWRGIRGTHIFTNRQYECAIEKLLTTENMTCVVKDILCVPDYVAYLQPHMGKFERYAKSEWTQLQFIFESTDVDEKYFPLGVKIQYRAFCADKVILLKQTSKHLTGLEPMCIDVTTYPLEDKEAGTPAGLSLLQSLPSGTLKPAAFVQGSTAVLRGVLISIEKHFKVRKPHIVKDWKQWISTVAPASDDAGEYILKHPLYIPLARELFGIVDSNDVNVPHAASSYESIPAKKKCFRSTASVVHKYSSKRLANAFEEYDPETGNAITNEVEAVDDEQGKSSVPVYLLKISV